MIIKKLIISFTLFSTFANALVLDVNMDSRRVVISHENQDYRIKLPKGVNSVESDGQYVYMSSKNDIRILVRDDIKTVSSEKDYSLVPYWQLSLKKELNGKSIKDIAAQSIKESHVIHVAVKNETKDSFTLKSFYIGSNNEGSESITSETARSQNKEGLFTLKSKVDLMGEGEITIVREPNSGGSLLLSLDKEKELVHTYSLENPLNPQYKASYQLPLKTLKNVRITSMDSKGSSFILESDDYKQKLSIYALKAKQYMLSSKTLMALENNVTGNAWFYKFFFFGVFSNVLDMVDGLIGNPFELEKEVENNPVLKKLANGITDNEVFDYLIEQKLGSKEQVEALRTKYYLDGASGAKWFGTVMIVASMVSFYKFKSKAGTYSKAGRDFLARANKVALKAFSKSTTLTKISKTSLRKLSKFDRALRARMVKNFLNEGFPAHAIESIQNKLVKSGIITKERVKELKKLSYKKQYVEINEIFKNNAKEIAKNHSALLKDLDNLHVFIKRPMIVMELRTKKAQILKLLNKYDPNYKTLNLRSDDALGFINATDDVVIANKVVEFEKITSQFSRTELAHYKSMKEDVTKSLEGLKEISESIQKVGTDGTVHPMFNKWAALSQRYAHFMVFNDKWLRTTNSKFGKLINEYTRKDAIKIAPGHMEYVKIKGDHAKAAFYGGFADTVGEVISQTVARSTLIDPNERIIGSGDNFFEIGTFFGKEIGVHFNLLTHALGNLAGWWVGMPLSFAKMKMSFGAKGKVTLWQREIDGVKKMFNPINYFYSVGTMSLPINTLVSELIKWDYRLDHEEKGDLNDKDYEKFSNAVSSRLTSLSSFLEALFIGVLVEKPYVSSQYMIHAELDTLIRRVFNSSTPGVFLSSFILPLTSGFMPNRWGGEYFGTDNPAFIKLLTKFRADGVLAKIDNDGNTDINSWSEHEKNVFFNLVVGMEMQKHAKTNPLSENATDIEKKEWMTEVTNNLLGESFKKENISKVTNIVKIGSDSSDKFKYEVESKELLRLIDSIQDNTTVLPFVKNAVNDESKLLAKTLKASTKHVGADELSEISLVQAKLSEALGMLNANDKAISRQEKTLISLAVFDSLYLASTLLFEGQIASRLPKLLGSIFYVNDIASGLHKKVTGKEFDLKNAKNNKKMVSRISSATNKSLNAVLNSNVLLMASIPLYLWIDDQLDAHINIQAYITDLIAKLQNILFSMTKVVVNESLKGNIEAYKNIDNLTKYRSEVLKKGKIIEDIMSTSQLESEKYLNSRIYRFPKIAAQGGPIFMGISAAWIFGHYMASKRTVSFVPRMADKFAPGLFKYGLIAWLSMGQVDSIIQKNIQIHTIDFINLYNSYYTSLVEVELLNVLIEKDESVVMSDKDIYTIALEKASSKEGFLKMKRFSLKLQELGLIGESVE